MPDAFPFDDEGRCGAWKSSRFARILHTPTGPMRIRIAITDTTTLVDAPEVHANTADPQDGRSLEATTGTCVGTSTWLSEESAIKDGKTRLNLYSVALRRFMIRSLKERDAEVFFAYKSIHCPHIS